MKSNRQARRLLALGKGGQIFRISNTREMHQIFDSTDGFGWVKKPSRRQHRAAKAPAYFLPEEAECSGCGKWGEVNFGENEYYCGGSPRCCP